MEAIVSATGGAAGALRQERELGTLEAGKRADLLVLDGDPLADLGALQRVVQVVKNGVLVAG
jgi:imidazolonepropionase-like amidohydrolase